MASPASVARDQTERYSRRWLRLTVYALSAVCMIISVFAIFVGFHQNLYSFHGFRQTQTALAAESMLHGGSFLHYEVPVLGPPWSLPFEFPLYQWIVARTVSLLHSPLEETGRAVSIVFFYLCFLNKLAANIARARDASGVHWRSDGRNGLLLGEAVAIKVLKDLKANYWEQFAGFQLTKFNGRTIVI